MNKKIIVSILAALIPASVQLAEAQQAKRVARVGLLAGGRGFGSAGDAFRHSLRELGWVEGAEHDD
jgi:hypothetical protein